MAIQVEPVTTESGEILGYVHYTPSGWFSNGPKTGYPPEIGGPWSIGALHNDTREQAIETVRRLTRKVVNA